MSGTDLLPKPSHSRLPVFMTGRGQQEIDWIAANADGWLFYTLPLQQQELNVRRWRRLTAQRGEPGYKPFNQATYIDLTEDPKSTPRAIGVDQLMINFKHSRRPVCEVMAELSEYVLPHFPAGNLSHEPLRV
jgi:hypothetical protein